MSGCGRGLHAHCHSVTLYWHWADQFYLYFLNVERQAKEQLIPFLKTLVWPSPGIEPATSRSQSGRSTTSLRFISLSVDITASIQRRLNVDATSWRCIDVEATLYRRHVSVDMAKIADRAANGVEPDQMMRFYVCLHCLLRPVCPNIYGKYSISYLVFLYERHTCI